MEEDLKKPRASLRKPSFGIRWILRIVGFPYNLVNRSTRSKFEKFVFLACAFVVVLFLYELFFNTSALPPLRKPKITEPPESQKQQQPTKPSKAPKEEPPAARVEPAPPTTTPKAPVKEEVDPGANGPIACKHFNLNPFDPEAMQFKTIADPKFKNSEKCTQEAWVRTEGSVIHINQEYGPMACTFEEILFIDDFRNAPWQDFRSQEKYQLLHSDFAMVNCEHKKTYKKWQSPVMGSVKFDRVWKHSGPFMYQADAMKVNVLLWGFASTSTSAFIREMPKSYMYLMNVLNGTLLRGYNAVGETAKANIVPLLTGKKEEDWPSTALSNPLGLFAEDAYPFLWDVFRRSGYVTAFFEDQLDQSIFHADGRGFRYRPTDHYSRPFFIERNVANKASPSGCYMNLTTNAMGQSYIKGLWDAYQDRLKFFVSFQGEYSQNDSSRLGLIDSEFESFLKWFKESDNIANTILIVFGDQGGGNEAFRQTHQGRMEQRKPFMYVKLPQWFIDGNPQIDMNLRRNSELLITPMDISKTLTDVLKMKKLEFSKIQSRKEQALNILRPLPKSRTCSDAGVHPHWCGCMDWTTLDASSPLSREIATTAVNFINTYTQDQLATFKKGPLPSETCTPLSVGSILWLVKLQGNAVEEMRRFEGDKNKNDTEYYEIFFTTTPGDAKFDVTVSRDPKTNKLYLNEHAISRANVYRHHSFCIAKRLPSIRKFCYCGKLQENNGTTSKAPRQQGTAPVGVDQQNSTQGSTGGVVAAENKTGSEPHATPLLNTTNNARPLTDMRGTDGGIQNTGANVKEGAQTRMVG